MMHDETGLWRKPPPTPYRPSGRITTATESILATTVKALRSVGRVEAACLWLGNFDGRGNGRAEAVVIPRQLNYPRNYHVPPESMRAVATIARPRKWTLVAAIHSHPGVSVEHSTYDDEMTPSRNALSIVFANYAAGSALWPQGVGVHEYIDDYWHLLPAPAATQRVVFVQGKPCEIFDLR